ncbi:MAG: endonuclease/exonuclease/phosphatase family protein [Gillisia sp.]
MKLKTFLQIFGVIAVVATLVPLFAADFWWIRIYDFFHIQLTLLTLTALAAYFIRFDIKRKEDYIFMGVLLTCFIYQLIAIYPYFPHKNYFVGEASPTQNENNLIHFYAANVFQDNTDSSLLIKDIEEKDPDILLLTETDLRWRDNLSQAVLGYPYKVEVPLDNTYGMLLYSKLEMLDPQVRFLVDDSIPSIHTMLKLRSGDLVQFYAIHPTPPMPQHNPSSSDRDAEMMLVAKMAKDSKLPVIVAGDFNDVAWSGTTALFAKIGGLLDTRVGRGFFNSFDATSFLMRWPLDHFFVSEEFRVKKFNLGNDIGSDHFPVEIILSLEPERAEEQKPEPATQDQIKQADEQIKVAREKQEEKKKNGE